MRLTRVHVAVLALSGLTGASLLLFSAHKAQALRDVPEVSERGQMVESLLPIPSLAPAGADLPVAEAVEPPDPVVDQVPFEPVTETAAVEQQVELAEADEEAGWESVIVRSGDSLSAIFTRAGLSPRTLHGVMNAGEAARSLRRIFPGDEISFLIADGELLAMRYAVDESTTLHVERNGERYASSLLAKPLETRLTHARAVINSSLFLAGKEAGLSDRLIMELAGIFGWDIDFALDIRAGDRFSVVYEELYRDGEKIRTGAIVAAEFINQGRQVRAVRFQRPDGGADYYSPDGRSMRKAFLRSPVDFRRISSGFNPNRLHPVLGTNRPHRGVDYAAATGTPIRAAGDGRIVHHGWKGGYGRTIVIQHGSRYSTLYAHMNGYARGLSNGSRVRQGQVIGYVGSSGMATGPHLHYEFLVDGVHRNPVTVKLPDAEPIGKDLLAAFQEQTGPLVAKLDVIGRGELAASD
jgi:murein DD-endopeptidase MepM/ murein hydrolase activator NlpD